MEKMSSDEYSSINVFFDAMLEDRELFEIKVLEMGEKQLIELYQYVSLRNMENDNDEAIAYYKRYLEALDVVQEYLNGDLKIAEITAEEQRSIEETVQTLMKRRKSNPIKKFINYFKA